MFHHYFFTLPPDDKYIRYTMEKAMYLVDETGLAPPVVYHWKYRLDEINPNEEAQVETLSL